MCDNSNNCFGYGVESNAKNYAKYRPLWPRAVYEKILSYLDAESVNGIIEEAGRGLAVDVGCGSGQSTSPLAEYFRSVVGVDPSEAQLIEARRVSAGHKNITYRLGPAEQLSSIVEEGSVDLITSGIALHFFDLEKFFSECNRVLKVGGVFAAYSCLAGTWDNERANHLIKECFSVTMKGYWFSLSDHVTKQYEEPFATLKRFFKDPVRDDSLKIEFKFSLEEVIGYIKTFPVYCNYKLDHPEQPDDLDILLEKLKDVYGTTSTTEKLATGSTTVSLIMGRRA